KPINPAPQQQKCLAESGECQDPANQNDPPEIPPQSTSIREPDAAAALLSHQNLVQLTDGDRQQRYGRNRRNDRNPEDQPNPTHENFHECDRLQWTCKSADRVQRLP